MADTFISHKQLISRNGNIEEFYQFDLKTVTVKCSCFTRHCCQILLGFGEIVKQKIGGKVF